MRVGRHLTPALHATVLVQAFFRPSQPLPFPVPQQDPAPLLGLSGGAALTVPTADIRYPPTFSHSIAQCNSYEAGVSRSQFYSLPLS